MVVRADVIVVFRLIKGKEKKKKRKTNTMSVRGGGGGVGLVFMGGGRWKERAVVAVGVGWREGGRE